MPLMLRFELDTRFMARKFAEDFKPINALTIPFPAKMAVDRAIFESRAFRISRTSA